MCLKVNGGQKSIGHSALQLSTLVFEAQLLTESNSDLAKHSGQQALGILRSSPSFPNPRVTDRHSLTLPGFYVGVLIQSQASACIAETLLFLLFLNVMIVL